MSRRSAWVAGLLAATLLVFGIALPSGAGPTAPAVGCSWTLKLNGMHGVNAGWPDNAATYWYSQYVTVPGARLVIHGEYAHARFFTLDVYDAKANPYVPDFYDAGLQPDPGSRNPYTRRGVHGPQYWTAHVDFGSAPAHPAANTIYAGTLADGSGPNPGGLMTLRVYLPNDPKSDEGGVPLPSMSLELPNGTTQPLRACTVPETVPVQPALQQAIGNLGWPDPAPAVVPFPLAKNPPAWTATENPNADNLISSTVPLPATPPHTGVGLLTTPNNSYIATRISRRYGEVFVLRAKAPTSPDTRAGQWVGTPLQLRYWSVCEFSTMTGQTAACLSDHEITRDADGNFTVVISDPAHRPTNAPNWLPVGDPYDGWPNVRQFLPNPGFPEAIGNLTPGADLATAMGPYFPQSGYCSTKTFEAGGVSACLASGG